MPLEVKQAGEDYELPATGFVANERIKIEAGQAIVGIAKELRYVETGEDRFVVLTLADEEGNLYDLTGWLTSRLVSDDGTKRVSPFGPQLKEFFAVETEEGMMLKPELVDAKVEIAKVASTSSEGRTYHQCGVKVLEQPNKA